MVAKHVYILLRKYLHDGFRHDISLHSAYLCNREQLQQQVVVCLVPPNVNPRLVIASTLKPILIRQDRHRFLRQPPPPLPPPFNPNFQWLHINLFRRRRQLMMATKATSSIEPCSAVETDSQPIPHSH
jgi:hypothetical protein